MSKKEQTAFVPKLRFLEFANEEAWGKVAIGKYLAESRIKGSTGDIAKKLTVKLWGKGVFGKEETLIGSKNTQYFRRKSGQFIYSKLDFLNQAFGIVPRHLDGYESTVDLPCFDVSEKLNVRFLLEYVQRSAFYKKYGEVADGGRKAKRIQVEIFLGFPMYKPKFKEQQKIADCLSSLDDLIAAENEKLLAFRAHKKGLMQKLFPAKGETVPEWRFSEFRDGDEWEKKSLGDICITIMSGKSKKASTHTKVPLIGSTGIIGCCDTVDYDGELILIARVGANAGQVNFYNGKCGVSDNTLILIVNNTLADNLFVRKWLDYFNINKLIFGSGQPLITGGQLKELNIFMPNPLEQQKIADCLSSLDDLISAQAEKIVALKVHKKGLMQGLFPSIEEVEV